MVKKVSILIAALALSAAAVSAQKTMHVMVNGASIFSMPVSEIDSVIFYDPPAPEEPECPEVEVGVVVNGIRWATRNLDEGGVFVENPEDYGALYQWGRKADGHESRTSENYPNNNNDFESAPVNISELDANGQVPNTHFDATYNTTAYGKFIKNNSSATYGDWRTPQDATLWNNGDGTNPIKSPNDPCPCGWRLPTSDELTSLVGSGTFTTHNGTDGYLIDGTLFLPAAGYHQYSNGSITPGGIQGRYWGSGVDSNYSTSGHYLYFINSGDVVMGSQFRAQGFSVRCVADE